MVRPAFLIIHIYTYSPALSDQLSKSNYPPSPTIKPLPSKVSFHNSSETCGENGEIIKRANVLGYPFNLLLDKDLNLIKAQPGHLNSDQIKQFVKE